MSACHHLLKVPVTIYLGHVVWQAGNHDAGRARHAGILAGDLINCNFYD
jgi:hypothetical protein